MIERAGGNGTTPETHPELYAFPGPRESSGLREELAKMSMELVDLKIEAEKLRLTVERVRAYLTEWKENIKDSDDPRCWYAKALVSGLQAVLDGDHIGDANKKVENGKRGGE